MKKFFFLALALTVCAFTFVSCEKEKDKDNSSTETNFKEMIVGTWQYARYWDSEEKEWYDDVDHFLFIFDAKGNVTQDYKDGEPETFKYHVEKDIIYFGDAEDKDSDWKDWDATYKISSISSNKMVLMYVDGEGKDKLEFEKQ